MKLKFILPNGDTININYKLDIKFYLHDDEIREINEKAGKIVIGIDIDGTIERVRKRLTVELYKYMDKFIENIIPYLREELEYLNQTYYGDENKNEEKTP